MKPQPLVAFFSILLICLNHCLGQTPGSQKWSQATGGPVEGSPAIGPTGTIYTTSRDGLLYAMDPGTGSITWTLNLQNTSGDVTTSPTIGPDGTIYVCATDGSTGSLYAINPDGSFKWPAPFTLGAAFDDTETSVSTPAVGDDGTIYVTGDDYDPVLFAVNPDGTLKWSLPNNGYDFGDAESSPVIGSDCTIYFMTEEEGLFAVSKTGQVQWTFPLPASDFFNSALSVGPDDTIYVGSSDNNLYAINPDGTQKWVFPTGGAVKSSPAIGSDGTIYVGSSDNNLYAITSAGSQKWAFTTSGNIESSPAVGADGTVYVGSDDGNIYAINNGIQRWVLPTSGAVRSSPAISSSGTVFAGSADGNVYAINGSTALASSSWPMYRKNPSHTGSQATCPAIFWISPANNAPFCAPATIDLVVGTVNVAAVKFFNGTTFLGSGTAGAGSTWSFTWQNVPAGIYQITAEGLDVNGQVIVEEEINLTVGSGSDTPVVFTGGIAPDISDTTFSFGIQADNGEILSVFASYDLVSWQPIGAVVTTGGSALFTDGTITGLQHKFYRASNCSHTSRIIGFTRTIVPGGGSAFCANQFEQPSYALPNLLSPMADGTFLPDGTVLGKLAPLTGPDSHGGYSFPQAYPYYAADQWTYYTNTAGSWPVAPPTAAWEGSDPAAIVGLTGNESLAPGEGAIIQDNSGAGFTVTFVGLVPTNYIAPLVQEWNLVSSVAPEAGTATALFGLKPANMSHYYTIVSQIVDNQIVTTARDRQGVWKTGPAQDISEDTLVGLYDYGCQLASSGTVTAEPTIKPGESVLIWAFDNYFGQLPARAPALGDDQVANGQFAFDITGSPDSYWMMYVSSDQVNWHFAGGIYLVDGLATFTDEVQPGAITLYYELVLPNYAQETFLNSGQMGIANFITPAGNESTWITNPFIYQDSTLNNVLPLSAISGVSTDDILGGNFFVDLSNPVWAPYDFVNLGDGWYTATFDSNGNFTGYTPLGAVATFGYGESLLPNNETGTDATITLHGQVP